MDSLIEVRMTDKSEPTKQELEQRVEQLEEYVSKMMPSRRDVLKAGGGGLLGGAAVLSATNSAAAADDSPDALGAAGDSMDVYLDQIRRPDGSGVVGDLDPSGTFDWSIGHSMPSVDTEVLVNDRHYAGAYSGSDPDDRLNNAIAAASTRDVIYLENTDYNADRTISDRYEFVGTNVAGTDIVANWTLDANAITLRHLNVTGTVNLNGFNNYVLNAAMFGGGSTEIIVNGGQAVLHGLTVGSVTFNSGASGGIVDSTAGTSVTDNDGGNTVGDIA